MSNDERSPNDRMAKKPQRGDSRQSDFACRAEAAKAVHSFGIRRERLLFPFRFTPARGKKTAIGAR
jgi:hypothetical protein